GVLPRLHVKEFASYKLPDQTVTGDAHVQIDISGDAFVADLPLDLPEEDTLIQCVGPFFYLQQDLPDTVAYYRQRIHNNLRDPFGTIPLSRRRMDERSKKDAMTFAERVAARGAWYQRLLEDPDSSFKAIQFQKLGAWAERGKWNLAKAITAWGYIQDAPHFYSEMEKLAAALEGEAVEKIPFVEDGRQIVLHLRVGEYALRHFKAEDLVKMGFTVMTPDGELHAGVLPVTVVLHECMSHPLLEELRTKVSGTLKRGRAERFWIDFPAYVTGLSSWFETASSGSAYLHDDNEADRSHSENTLARLCQTLVALDDRTGRKSWTEVERDADELTNEFLMGRERSIARYDHLEEWTRFSRRNAELLYGLNMIDDLTILLARYARANRSETRTNHAWEGPLEGRAEVAPWKTKRPTNYLMMDRLFRVIEKTLNVSVKLVYRDGREGPFASAGFNDWLFGQYELKPDSVLTVTVTAGKNSPPKLTQADLQYVAGQLAEMFATPASGDWQKFYHSVQSNILARIGEVLERSPAFIPFRVSEELLRQTAKSIVRGNAKRLDQEAAYEQYPEDKMESALRPFLVPGMDFRDRMGIVGAPGEFSRVPSAWIRAATRGLPRFIDEPPEDAGEVVTMGVYQNLRMAVELAEEMTKVVRLAFQDADTPDDCAQILGQMARIMFRENLSLKQSHYLSGRLSEAHSLFVGETPERRKSFSGYLRILELLSRNGVSDVHELFGEHAREVYEKEDRGSFDREQLRLQIGGLFPEDSAVESQSRLTKNLTDAATVLSLSDERLTWLEFGGLLETLAELKIPTSMEDGTPVEEAAFEASQMAPASKPSELAGQIREYRRKVREMESVSAKVSWEGFEAADPDHQRIRYNVARRIISDEQIGEDSRISAEQIRLSLEEKEGIRVAP
ncbi:MAG: hypothetical protein PHN49_12815, partial [Candidatus Omnitrophica bacterium]|nr:hypothetical protein [Candidatus Omnitrophota bacterium]